MTAPRYLIVNCGTPETFALSALFARRLRQLKEDYRPEAFEANVQVFALTQLDVDTVLA